MFMYPSTDCSSPLYTSPEFNLTVTGTPMMEERKLAGSFGSVGAVLWFSIFGGCVGADVVNSWY